MKNMAAPSEAIAVPPVIPAPVPIVAPAPGKLRRFCRHVPWKTLLVLLFVVALVGAPHLFALYHWHKAQDALDNDEFTDAKRHLDWCVLVWDSAPVNWSCSVLGL